jgi:hypothetical protein
MAMLHSAVLEIKKGCDVKLGERPDRIFLISPANAGGKRAGYLSREGATFELAQRLREEDAPLGEIFSFISGLYFRGKLAYASAFASAPAGVRGVHIITACGGLVGPEERFGCERLAEISSADVHANEPKYREPLERDARRLVESISADCQVVLLGSVATPKYVEPLLSVFGDRLVFPAEFAGRGDMSRGGLMLRCVSSGVELQYVAVQSGQRHGTKPAKLEPLHPRRSKRPLNSTEKRKKNGRRNKPGLKVKAV